MSRLRLVACGALAVGCGGALQSLTASPDDYEAYRRTRTAGTTEQRLAASQRYLDQMPEGRWRAEVERWFDRAEPLYFQRAERSPAGLRTYLDALPRGPHAERAAERLAELALATRHQRRRDQRLLDEARRVEEKLDDADRMRRELVRELTAWVAELGAISSFGRPTGELDHQLIFHFRLEEPKGRCVASRCVKRESRPYAVPEGKRLAPRRALYEVVLELDNGGVARAELVGPELFSRVAEAADVRVVGPNDAQGRAEAIARAVALVQTALGARFADPACQREAVSPEVLVRECGGARVTLTAAATAEEDDRLRVEPIGDRAPATRP